MFELLIGAVILAMIIIVFNYFITSYYMNKIKEQHLDNTYKLASLIYKILQSDQVFSITSHERGYLDLVKIQVFIKNGEEQACKKLQDLVKSKVALRITNIERNSSILCNDEDNYSLCNMWEICSIPEHAKKYDLFISLYDIINNTVYIGKLEIWIS